MKLSLENVRCFAGKHEIPIKPLTILVGENSSGKSTVLAMLSAICDPVGFPMQPKFNDSPYSLGSYDTIATYKGGKFGRAKSFSIGYSNPKDDIVDVKATYRNNQGQVQISQFYISSQTGGLELHLDDVQNRNITGNVTIYIGKEHKSFKFSIPTVEIFNRNFLQNIIYSTLIEREEGKSNKKNNSKQTYAWIRQALLIFDLIKSNPTFSIAPIRTKPKRTYDQVTEGFNPEGDDIPFLLARLMNESMTSRQKKVLVYALQRYGEASGLFKTVGVKKLGTKFSDPFQVLVTVAGRPANLLDVGYGISQALPVVIHSILLSDKRLLLLQQPEVHLHPKAQAALGSFFVDLVAEGDKKFVIETHSDYILDRIRQEVAYGKIKAESVGILFFDRNGIETNIHQIELDKLGNIINAPSSYRTFFLQEELNLLKRTP